LEELYYERAEKSILRARLRYTWDVISLLSALRLEEKQESRNPTADDVRKLLQGSAVILSVSTYSCLRTLVCCGAGNKEIPVSQVLIKFIESKRINPVSS
jgi:hypothetical protein